MKKVISLILVALLLTATCSVAFSAYSVVDEGALSAAEAVAAYEAEEGEILKARVYFQMPNGNSGPTADSDVMVHIVDTDPETGEPIDEHDEVFIEAGQKANSWYCDYNVLPEDGKHYAGVYWWDSGVADPSSWAGWRMEIDNEEQGIFYVDLPCSEDLTTIIFNNGVDGGMDPAEEIYPWAYQTVDINCEGAGEGEFDTLPYGSPNCNDDSDLAYSFNQCIAVVNPNSVTVNDTSGRISAGVNWYVYYGNGCYGMYYEGCDEYTGDVAQDCCNPDHFKNGVHVGYQGGGGDEHTHTIEHVDTVYSTTEHEGMKEHYECTGCHKLFSDEAGENEVTAESLTTPIFVPQEGWLYFDAATTGWSMTSKDSIAFSVFGGDIVNGLSGKKSWGKMVENTNYIYGFDSSKLKDPLNEGVQYKIIFYHVQGGANLEQTYDLLFDTTCLAGIAYCDGSMTENPVDSTKMAATAYWYGKDHETYGPPLQISSIGNVIGSSLETGMTKELVFTNWLTVPNAAYQDKTGYQNAIEKVVDVGTKTEQQLIDDIGEDLGFTKQDVYDALTQNEIESAWDYTVSTLPGEVVVPHTHTPGDAVQENVVNATCTTAGSYDEVVRCTECGEIISSTPKTIEATGHNMTFHAEIPATETANGTAAHYTCSKCNGKFLDQTGTQPVTDAQLIIPMLAHTHTAGTTKRENLVPATCTAEGSYDEVTYCSGCGAEMNRVHKTIAKKAHTLSFVAKVEPTYDATGMEAHYECSVCHKLFSDAAGSVEVTAASLVIPKKVRPTGILGDADNTGEVDIVDVTFIQRIDLGIINADEGMIARGDIDKSGAIEITDATRVQRWLVGIEDGFGIGQSL